MQIIKLDIKRVEPCYLKNREFEAVLRKALQVIAEAKELAELKQFYGLKTGIIELVITDDDDIQQLNYIYNNKNKPTDVLSFSFMRERQFPGHSDLIGQIVISMDTARNQAKKLKNNLKSELLFLFIHGFLHIIGLDHQSEAEYEQMYDLQDLIIQRN